MIFLDRKAKRPKSSNELIEVRVKVEDAQNCNYPQFGEDESYSIIIFDKKRGPSYISAKSIWGALRGLETFSQLVYQVKGYYIIHQIVIQDWPEYSHRGLLLDTARHYIPIKTILMNLDAMAYNKFNVFHWHLVDDQSFPFESKYYPELMKNGAYSSKHVYTQNDIRFIIDYARMRGIRVIPEVDSPGHTKVFGKSFPSLLTPCYGTEKPFTSNFPQHSEAEILNPISEETYDFMKTLFQEIKNLFPDEYIHLGMDEVYYACWKSNPSISKFMADNGLTNINEIEQYYVQRTIDNVKELDYKYVVWQDPVDNGVKVNGNLKVHNN